MYVEMLDNNSGNSNTGQRIDLLEKGIALVGKSRINAVIADREFVGQQWINYLIEQGIGLFLRVPKSYVFHVNGVALKAEQLLSERNSCKLDNVDVLELKGLR